MAKDRTPRGIEVGRAAELIRGGEALALDVREPNEWDAGHIPGATHVPMDEVQRRVGELPTDRPVIAVCRSGGRSGRVANKLRSRGFEIENLEGGMLAWQEAGLPIDPAGGRVAEHRAGG